MRTSLKGYVQNMLNSEDENGGAGVDKNECKHEWYLKSGRGYLFCSVCGEVVAVEAYVDELQHDNLYLSGENGELQRENAELRAKLQKAETMLQDVKTKHDYVKRCNAENAKFCDDIVQENDELRKQMETAEMVNKPMQKSMSEQQQLLNSYLEKSKLQNTTIETMRAALENLIDDVTCEVYLLEDIDSGVAKSAVMDLRDATAQARKALSTTPSQAAERQKRIVELLKDNQFVETTDIRVSGTWEDGYYKTVALCKYCGGFNHDDYDFLANKYGQSRMRDGWTRGHKDDCKLAAAIKEAE